MANEIRIEIEERTVEFVEPPPPEPTEEEKRMALIRRKLPEHLRGSETYWLRETWLDLSFPKEMARFRRERDG